VEHKQELQGYPFMDFRQKLENARQAHASGHCVDTVSLNIEFGVVVTRIARMQGIYPYFIDLSSSSALDDPVHVRGNVMLMQIPKGLRSIAAKVLYLSVASADIRSIPEWIGECQNLTTLQIQGCLPYSTDLVMTTACHNIKMQTLPAALWTLPKLQVLSVKNFKNLLVMPSDVAKLTALHSLCIEEAWQGKWRLCGRIASNQEQAMLLDVCGLQSICAIQSLQTLCIADCHHVRFLPNNLDRLWHLHTLTINHMSRLACLPDSIAHSTSLRHLSLKELPLVHMSHKVLAGFPHLESINLCELAYSQRTPEGNGVGHVPLSLYGLTNLTRLKMDCADDVYELPPGIARLERLVSLDMFALLSLHTLPAGLGKLRSLRTIFLHHLPCLEALPEEITQQGMLESISVKSCKAFARIPTSLSKLTRLRLLCLEIESRPDTRADDIGVHRIGSVTSLTELQLSLDLCELPISFHQLVQLQVFSLSIQSEHTPLPSNAAIFPQIASFLTRLSKLQHLFLSHENTCECMLDKTLQHVLQTDGIFAALYALRAYPPVGLTQCDVQTVYSKTYDEDNVLQGYTLCDASTWLHAQPNTFGLPPDNYYGVCCDMYTVCDYWQSTQEAACVFLQALHRRLGANSLAHNLDEHSFHTIIHILLSRDEYDRVIRKRNTRPACELLM